MTEKEEHHRANLFLAISVGVLMLGYYAWDNIKPSKPATPPPIVAQPVAPQRSLTKEERQAEAKRQREQQKLQAKQEKDRQNAANREAFANLLQNAAIKEGVNLRYMAKGDTLMMASPMFQYGPNRRQEFQTLPKDVKLAMCNMGFKEVGLGTNIIDPMDSWSLSCKK